MKLKSFHHSISREPGRFRSVWLLLATLVLLLTACGDSDDPDPTPTPEPTATIQLLPGQITLGQLLDPMSTSFAAVTSMRSTFTSNNIETGAAVGTVTVEEFVSPASRRIVVLQGETVLDEQIAIDGEVWLRGQFVATAVAPMLGNDVWVTVDIALVPADTPVGNVVGYLTGPMRIPFANASDTTRNLGLTQTGTEEIEGRTCTKWSFVNTTSFGDQISYELAVDDRGLPCRLTEIAGTIQNTTTFAFDMADLTIVPPEDAEAVSGTPEG